MEILTDITCWIYSIRIIVEILLIGAFCMIWQREKVLPTLIGCLVFMVACQLLVDFFHLYTRAMRFADFETYRWLLTSMWWPGRLIPELIVLVYVLFHAAVLAYCPERYR